MSLLDPLRDVLRTKPEAMPIEEGVVPIYVAASSPRTLGGFELYVRSILRALQPRPIEVAEYQAAPPFEDLPENAHVTFSSSKQSLFGARFAYDYLTRPPTLFIVSHVGLMRALTGFPRQTRHRIVLLLAGREAWQRLRPHRGRCLSLVDSFVFFATFNREMFVAANRSFMREDAKTEMIWLSCLPEVEALRTVPVPNGPIRHCIYIARILKTDPLKGLTTLLHAAKRLDPARWRIDIVGSGSGLESYRKLAADLGVQDRVRFTGKVTNEERTRLLAEADVLCLPSAQEGFGIVYMEAMIVGRPSVGAAAGAVPEVIPPPFGEIPPYGDDQALAAAIERASDRLRSGELTPTSIRAFYDERYSYAKFARSWGSLVDELRREIGSSKS